MTDDILERLRPQCGAVDTASIAIIFKDAACEIEELRARLGLFPGGAITPPPDSKQAELDKDNMRRQREDPEHPRHPSRWRSVVEEVLVVMQERWDNGHCLIGESLEAEVLWLTHNMQISRVELLNTIGQMVLDVTDFVETK